MKKLSFWVALVIALFVVSNVSAKEVFYTSDNGVELSVEEYAFLTAMYDLNYVKNLTSEKFAVFANIDFENDNINIVSYTDNVSLDSDDDEPTRSSWIQTSAKRLSLAAACNSQYCTMITSLIWLGVPTITSYDVVGARLTSTLQFISDSSAITVLDTSVGSTTYTNHTYKGRGIGVSIKLPSGATYYNITQSFGVEGSGKVQASYQHAKKNVSLATSKLYNISSIGYGGVFDFTGNAIGKYDGMQGVNLNISV